MRYLWSYFRSNIRRVCCVANTRSIPVRYNTTEAPMLSVRLATLDDYEAVMNLGRSLFDGMDYLPYTYHWLMGDRSWMCFVMERDAEVVAFNGVHLVSGGKCLMERSGRVASHVQRQGIMKFLEEAVLSYTLKLFPSVEFFHGTIKNTSPYIKGDSLDPMFTRSVVAFKQKESDTGVLILDDNLTEVTQSQMSALFRDAHNSERLFPSRYISIRWCFFEISDCELDFIYRFSQKKYATYTRSSNDCRLLTIGVHFRCRAGYVYHMECYGDTAPEVLIPHVHRHLHHARQAAPSGVDVYFYAYTWKEEFKLDEWLGDEMEKCGFDRYNLDYYCYLGWKRNICDVISVNDQ